MSVITSAPGSASTATSSRPGGLFSRPACVVFDLGKVLVDFDYGIAARRLATASRLDSAGIRALIDQAPLLLRYERGGMSTAEFFDTFRAAAGYTGDLAQFREAFADIFSEMPPMVALHGELRAAGVPVYVFSNTNEIAVAHCRRRFPFFSQFDGYVLSYEHAGMKPEPHVYEVVERMTGHRGADLLYIDDRIENIETGRQRGWQTIWQQDPAETIRQVRARQL